MLRNIRDWYKDEKNRPVFIMVIAGMTAILFSFGYLLQYSITEYLAQIRVNQIFILIIGFSISAALYISGLVLRNRKVYRLFAEALISLSILLNYLLIYFLADLSDEFPLFESPIVGFIFIVINTIVAVYASVKNKSRFIAAISMIGGALTPYYLRTAIGAYPYFTFLWLLAIASIITAWYLRWKLLGIIAFVLPYIVLEIHVFQHLTNFGQNLVDWLYLFVFQAFGFTYTWFCFFSIGQLKYPLPDSDLVIHYVNSVLVVFNTLFFFYPLSKGITSAIIAMDAIPFVILFVNAQRLKYHRLERAALLTSSLYVSLWIILSFQIDIIAFLLIIQAIVLLYIGLDTKQIWVRVISNILLLLCLIKILSDIPTIYYYWDKTLLTRGYAGILVLGIVILLLIGLYHKFRNILTSFEIRLAQLCDEFLSLWFTVVTILTFSYYSYQQLAYLCLIPTFLLLFRGHQAKLLLTLLLGYLLYICLLVYSLSWVIIQVVLDFEHFVPSVGFANLVASGLLLIGLRYWYIVIDVINQTKTGIHIRSINFEQKYTSAGLNPVFKQRIRLIDRTLYFWLLGFFALTFYSLSPQWIAFWMLVPAFLFIYTGYVNNKSFSLRLGYSIFFLFFIYISINTLLNIPLQWEHLSFTSIFTYLIQMGFFLGILIIIPRLIAINQYLFGLKKLNEAHIKFNFTLYPIDLLWYDIRAIVVAILSFQFGLKRIKPITPHVVIQVNKLLWNLLAVWFAVSYFVFARYVGSQLELDAWLHKVGLLHYNPEVNDHSILAYNLIFIPLLLLTALGGRKKMRFIEFVGLAHYFIMVFAAVVFIAEAGSVAWYRQTSYTLLLIIELAVISLGLYPFYCKFIPADNPQRAITKLLQNFVYLVLPLGLVAVATRRLYFAMPVLLWGAALLTFFLSEMMNSEHKRRPTLKLRNKTIVVEFNIWALLASLETIRYLLSTAEIHTLTYIIIIAGIVIPWAILIYKKGYSQPIERLPRYFAYPAFTYLYTGLYLASCFFLISNSDWIGAILLLVCYILVLLALARFIFVVRIAYQAFYQAAQAILSTCLLILLLQLSERNSFDGSNFFISLLLTSVSITGFYFLIFHSSNQSYKTQNQWWANFNLVWFNICLAVTYTAWLLQFQIDFTSMTITFIVLIHGLLLVIYSYKIKTSVVSALAYIFLGIVIIKFLFFDFGNLQTMNRFLVLLLIGGILLFTAFNFLRIKDKNK